MRRLVSFSLVFVALVFGLAGPALASGDDDIPGTPFAIGDSVSQTVSSGDVNDVYAVTLTVGEEVHIRCDPGAAGGGSFYLLVPGVSSINDANDYKGMAYTLSGGSLFRLWGDFDYIAAKSGTYYMWVEWDKGTLNYSLSVKRTSRPPLILAPDSNNIPGTPIGADTLTGVVSTNVDEYDVYSVGLTAGQAVTIRLTALTSSSGYLTLLDPSTPSISSRYSHQVGDWVTASKDKPAEIQHTPTQTGTYYILVDAAGSIFTKNFPYQLSVSAEGQPPETPQFSDVGLAHPYYDAITNLASRGVINGKTDGRYHPSDPVMRQQFAKMIVKTMGHDVSPIIACPFMDVDLTPDPNDPLFPAKYVAVCALHGITVGRQTPTTFDPYANIQRFQVLSMVARAVDEVEPGLLVTPPASFVPTWNPGLSDQHGLNAARAEYAGLLAGIDLSALDPFGNMTRGEIAQVLHNLLGKLTP